MWGLGVFFSTEVYHCVIGGEFLPWLPRKLVGSWDALGGGRGRFSFSSTLP